MRTYIIYFNDGSTDYCDAYSYKLKNGRATFDTGHGNTYVCSDVKRVELA